jgi:hypothetical protein
MYGIEVGQELIDVSMGSTRVFMHDGQDVIHIFLDEGWALDFLGSG